MIRVKKLNNGVRLVLEQMDSVESVSAGIWVLAGSVNESDDILGMSHLIEHMMFKGTEKRSARQIAADADRIGAGINAFTGKEATCYYIRALGSNLEPAVEILTDLFCNSVFDQAELKKEKYVIYEEIKMIEDAPDDDAHDILSELVFQGSPLESPIIGYRRTLEGISRDDMLNYMKREYSADNIVVSLAGHFDEALALELFEQALGGLTATKTVTEWSADGYRPRFRVKSRDTEQSHICLGRQGLNYEADLYYALSLLNSIFGGSMSSRLFQNIREDKGLAYAVYSVAQSHMQNGIFSIYAGVAHDKVEETVAAVAEELSRLEKDGVTAEELQAAKEQIKSAYVFGRESVSSRMFSNGKNQLLLDRQRLPEEVLTNIDRVTLDDMQQAIQLIASIDQYCGVLIGNRELDLAALIGAHK
ncbi:MAG TPA: insulinase family protein [Clostridiales bacterium]|jgi:predicted Zn-dependent peptidase|nr:insulinase family protein [Clostridiales bacterium]